VGKPRVRLLEIGEKLIVGQQEFSGPNVAKVFELTVGFIRRRGILVPDKLERVGKTRVGELVADRESLALDHRTGSQLDHDFSAARKNPAFAAEIVRRLLDFGCR
jgi:hypothetical protein